MPNCVAPTSTSNGYNTLYSSDSEDDPLFEVMVDSNSIKTINTYIVVPLPLTLVSTPPKVLNKKHNIRGRTILATIKRAQYNKTESALFLSTALRLVSHALTRANTNKITIYDHKDTACCADSGALEDMFPDYSTFKTYHLLYYCYATSGDTTRLPIEEIGTTV